VATIVEVPELKVKFVVVLVSQAVNVLLTVNVLAFKVRVLAKEPELEKLKAVTE